jgi:hypothetical protein
MLDILYLCYSCLDFCFIRAMLCALARLFYFALPLAVCFILLYLWLFSSWVYVLPDFVRFVCRRAFVDPFIVI